MEGSPSPLEFSQSAFMNNLCISGTGLYSVANTMNHSCLPNVAITCSTNSDEVSVLALTQIKAGDELLISYIDEDGPLAQRKKQLHEFYSFECTCARCLNEIRSST
jgi:SET domain-containing protein